MHYCVTSLLETYMRGVDAESRVYCPFSKTLRISCILAVQWLGIIAFLVTYKGKSYDY